MATTYSNLYLDLRARLKKAGAFDPTFAARELVCFASGKSREELVRDGSLYVSPEVEEQVAQLERRHLAGEPVAHLIGEWEFYGLPLDITPAVLIPRPDTEVLVEQVLSVTKELGACRVLDLCAGSGCVGLAIAAHTPAARVLLGELDEAALKICRRNIRRCNLAGRVTAMRVNALEAPAKQLGEFHAIACNPPYIPHAELERLDPSVRDYEPHLALDGGADGLDFYRAICEGWRSALCAGGLLAFEVGIGQAAAVAQLMREHGFSDVSTVRDLGGVERVVHGKRSEEET